MTREQPALIPGLGHRLSVLLHEASVDERLVADERCTCEPPFRASADPSVQTPLYAFAKVRFAGGAKPAGGIHESVGLPS